MSGGAKLEDIFEQIQPGETATLNLILKADVTGSLEALTESLRKLERDEVKLAFVHRASAASRRTTSSWPPRPTPPSSASTCARTARPASWPTPSDVEIRTYEIIYQLLEDIENAMVGLLAPEFEEVVTGEAEVREIFRVPRVGADRRLLRPNGIITRGSKVRFLREGIDHLEGHDHVAASASRTTSARSRPASSAASASPTSRTSSPATSSRPSRSGRSRGPSGGVCRCTCVALAVDLHLPDVHSLKEKRSVVTADRSNGAAGASAWPQPEVDHQDAAGSGPSWASRSCPDAAGHAVEVIDAVERFVWSFPEIEVLGAERDWLEVERERPTGDGRPPSPGQQYPRTARLNELLREIAGRRARAHRRRAARPGRPSPPSRSTPTCARPAVFFDSLSGEAGDAEVLEALGEARVRLQAAIGRQARVKRTPRAGVPAPIRPCSAGDRIDATSCDEPLPDDVGRTTTPGPRAADATGGRRGAPDGLVVVDKAARLDHPRRGGQGRAAVRHTQKVGHAGTLDPDATGVLLVGVGRVTRLLRFLTGCPSRYTGRGRARGGDDDPRRSGRGDGDATTWPAVTLDRGASRRRPSAHRRHPAGAADGLGGQGRRPPPARSWPARAIEVERAARPVTVSPLRPSDAGARRPPVLQRRRRVLLGHLRPHRWPPISAPALGGGAHLRNLRRTAVGPFTLDRAPSRSTRSTSRHCSCAAAARDLPGGAQRARRARHRDRRRLRQGARAGRARRPTGDGPWAVLGPDGALLAVYEAHRGGRRSSPRSSSGPAVRRPVASETMQVLHDPGAVPAVADRLRRSPSAPTTACTSGTAP